MSDSLFQYVQRPESLVSISPTAGGEGGDIWLELGDVAEAELLACEALEMDGERPRNLQRLALINAVKGETEAARVFLDALALDPVRGRLGKRGLERLQADPHSPPTRKFSACARSGPRGTPASTVPSKTSCSRSWRRTSEIEWRSNI